MSFVDEGPEVGISVDIGESVDVAGSDFLTVIVLRADCIMS